jgi:eukaryotic-like serine/threonine-protein kinase
MNRPSPPPTSDQPDANRVACDSDRLERYLSGQCDSRESDAVERHLNDCQTCRAAIETHAADASFWQSVTKNLDTRSDLTGGSESLNVNASGLLKRSIDHAMTLDYLTRWLNPIDDAADDANDGSGQSIGRLDKYLITDIVGVGGMGLVLRGVDPMAKRYVAIKTLRPHLTLCQDAVTRFRREAENAAAIDHPHVIAIYAVDQFKDMPYLVMPMVDGGSLSDRMASQTFSIDEVLSVGRQVAVGLSAAHALGIVHRDLKPSNVLCVDGIRHVVLADFGLARAATDESMTGSAAMLGTPQYMSPEQAQGRSVDGRSDLFSLGTLMHAMASGTSPFAAETPFATLSKIVHDDPPPLSTLRDDVPFWMDRLITRLLCKDPDDRFASAAEVESLIAQAIRHRDEPARYPVPDGLRDRATRWQLLLAMMAGLILSIPIAMLVQGRVGDPATAPGVTSKTGQQDAVVVGDSPPVLDDLERVNLVADLREGVRLDHWLPRLAAMPVGEIPADAIASLEKLRQHDDDRIAKAASEILDRNPFEVIP